MSGKPIIDATRLSALVEPENVTRRGFMFGALGAALLIACGDDEDEAPAEANRPVQDAFGTVEVPARPQRVIAVRQFHVGNMLALGVKPVAMVPDANEFPLPGHAEALAGVINVRAQSDWELDVEKALSLEPDLIIEMSGQPDDPWNQEVCDRAKAATPTLCFPYGYTYEADVKQNMIDIGEALGLQDKAAEVIAAYDSRVAELKTRAGAFAGKPVASIVWLGPEAGGFFVPVDRTANLILRALGIPEPSFQSSPDLGEVEFSFETMEKLNEAHAVIVMLEGATQETLEAIDVWKLLEPVKAGRVVFVDANLWGWDYMPALMYVLDEIESKVLPLA